MDNKIIQNESDIAVAEKPSVGEGLVIENLHVNVEGKEILKGVDLVVRQGEVHALMGPNGSGKSTLVNALMGNPSYKVTEGKASLNGANLLSEPPDERAKLGLFLGFQYPSSIPGVSVANFLRTALVSLTKPRARTESELLTEGGQVRREADGQDGQGQNQNLGLAEANYVGRGGVARPTSPAVKDFRKNLREKLALLKMDESFATRYVNDGFSGGEKKRLEVLQMAILKPKIAMLDEPDSGLDIDAVRVVSEGVNSLRGPEMGVLLVTHYQRILNYVKPDFVHVMIDGEIVRSGGPELAQELEAQGYDWLRADFGLEPQGSIEGDEHDNA
jgi:Fe-S cluster assembly ATP-binding protein